MLSLYLNFFLPSLQLDTSSGETLKIIQILCSSSKGLPRYSIHSIFLRVRVFTLTLAKWWFLEGKCNSFHTYQSVHSPDEQNRVFSSLLSLSLFFFLFYLLVSCMNTWIHVFSMINKLLLVLLILVLRLGIPSSWLLCPRDMPSLFGALLYFLE